MQHVFDMLYSDTLNVSVDNYIWLAWNLLFMLRCHIYHVLFYWGWFCQCVQSGCQEESPSPPKKRKKEEEEEEEGKKKKKKIESETSTLNYSAMTLAVIFCK